VDAVYKGFLIKTDQPVHQGGGDGARSVRLFLASIATCAGSTPWPSAGKSIPTENAGVVMRAEKDPKPRLISKIRIELRLPAGFPENIWRAVIKAVDYCHGQGHILKAPAFEITAEIPQIASIVL